jgi:hypothetical protein
MALAARQGKDCTLEGVVLAQMSFARWLESHVELGAPRVS